MELLGMVWARFSLHLWLAVDWTECWCMVPASCFSTVCNVHVPTWYDIPEMRYHHSIRLSPIKHRSLSTFNSINACQPLCAGLLAEPPSGTGRSCWCPCGQAYWRPEKGGVALGVGRCNRLFEPSSCHLGFSDARLMKRWLSDSWGQWCRA